MDWATFWVDFSPSIRDRCYDFFNIFAKKFSEKIGVFGHSASPRQNRLTDGVN
jgi:hypothetical protein